MARLNVSFIVIGSATSTVFNYTRGSFTDIEDIDQGVLNMSPDLRYILVISVSL